MGRKAKYTFEQKLKAAQDYLSGKKSAADIAFELDMGKYVDNRIRQWASLYKANGQEALKPKERNSSYSKEFKEMVVQDYVQNGLSPYELATKYNIPSKTVIDQWIKRYNNHIEQRDYCPHQLLSPSGGLYGRKKENNKRRKNGDRSVLHQSWSQLQRNGRKIWLQLFPGLFMGTQI